MTRESYRSRRRPLESAPLQPSAKDLRTAGKRRALWFGFAAVLLPLLVMLGMQYWWLADLQQTQSIARGMILQKFLDVVSKEVSYRYLSGAERTLNLPSSVFEPEAIQKAAYYFKKKQVKEARVLFLRSFLDKGRVYFYDPSDHSMYRPKHSDVTIAVWAATAGWEIVVKKGGVINTAALQVDERDPGNRIILNPITNESSKLVGLAGMIIDQDYFRDHVLPEAVKASMPAFPKQSELKVTVLDRDGEVVLPKAGSFNGKKRAWRHLSFVFSDWKIVLLGDLGKEESWARTSFVLNMTMSVVLAAVLLGGIGMTLRMASRELKLSMMKNDFVSNVSHELRTPLSSIRVFGEFMRRGRVSEQAKIREYGEYIESESRRLTQLINNILDFSRIESGRRVYSFDEADIEEVVTSALATCNVRLRSRGFTIEFHSPEEPLPLLRIDAGAIDRAVCNLLDNAAKYSGEGREIGVTLERIDSNMVISVEDQGIGISREEQQRIFDRFHRVSTGLVHDVKGSGLGLSIVQHILQAHGGTVTVQSELGKGSVFSLILPIEDSGERGKAATERK